MDKPSIHVVPALGQGGPADDDLMLLAQRGHREAFAEIVKRHQRLVLGLAIRFLGDATMGRDVAQEVFLSLWTGRDKYEPRGRLTSYLVSMTMHRCRHAARQQTSRAKKLELLRGSLSESVDTRLPLSALIETERRREVRAKLGELPEKCREALTLRFTHGLPLEEIAALTGQPLGTVKSHLSRGLRRLAKLVHGELP